MLRMKPLILIVAALALNVSLVPETAEAGPLLDWLRGRRSCLRPKTNNNACCATPSAQAYPVAGNYQGLQPGQCMKTCQQTCSRTVVNYVPQTCYRTTWKQVPVTKYKPVTNSDPCTGCTVTCMRPCTTYSYQMQRVPYTTYRPVYRTETYKVPVTTITNDCATGNCGTCSTGTCNTCPTGNCGGSTPAVNYAPTPATVNYAPSATTQSYTNYGSSVITSAPRGTLSTEGSYSAPSSTTIPADISPSLDGLNPQGSNLQRPIYEQIQAQSNSVSWPRTESTRYQSTSHERQPVRRNSNIADPQRDAPSVLSVAQRLSESQVRQPWAYSPVRLASHTTVVKDDRSSVTQQRPVYAGSFLPAKRTTSNVNSGWETVK